MVTTLDKMPAARPRPGFRRMVRELYVSIQEHAIFDLAAQLAYWMLLAVFPFFIFLLTLIGYLPLHGLDQALLDEMARVMPYEAAMLFQNVLFEVVGKQHGVLLVVALVGGLWSAAGGVNALMSALNRAYGVAETRPYWKVKFEAIVITVAGSVLVIVAAIALVVGPALFAAIAEWFALRSAFNTVWRFVHLPLAILAMLTLVAASYSILPNRVQPFRLLTPGTLVAVGLWLLSTVGFRLYVSHFHGYARTYGALGAAVVLMTWIYLTSLMVIVGGEVDAAFDRLARGTTVGPDRRRA